MVNWIKELCVTFSITSGKNYIVKGKQQLFENNCGQSILVYDCFVPCVMELDSVVRIMKGRHKCNNMGSFVKRETHLVSVYFHYLYF